MQIITLELTPSECKLVHEALMDRPFREVEQLVVKLRRAAAAALHAAQSKPDHPESQP